MKALTLQPGLPDSARLEDVSEPSREDGTAKADDITFNVVRSFQGQEVKIMYKGKAADGEIKFSSWRDGNEGQTREFTAKRVTS